MIREGPIRRRLRERREGKEEIQSKELDERRLEARDKTFNLCSLVVADPAPTTVVGYQRILYSSTCQVLDASLYAAKVSLPKGSSRRAFIQDLAASLNRRRLLRNKDVEEFWELAEQIMEEETK